MLPLLHCAAGRQGSRCAAAGLPPLRRCASRCRRCAGGQGACLLPADRHPPVPPARGARPGGWWTRAATVGCLAHRRQQLCWVTAPRQKAPAAVAAAAPAETAPPSLSAATRLHSQQSSRPVVSQSASTGKYACSTGCAPHASKGCPLLSLSHMTHCCRARGAPTDESPRLAMPASQPASSPTFPELLHVFGRDGPLPEDHGRQCHCCAIRLRCTTLSTLLLRCGTRRCCHPYRRTPCAQRAA